MKSRSPNEISVVLVDDHRMFREQLAHLIERAGDMRGCGAAENVVEAFSLVRQVRPSVALVDITLKGASGLELVKQLRAQKIDVPVLVLSMHEESLYAERALRAGANGYITKHEASAEVLEAIRRVVAGGGFVGPALFNPAVGKK